MKKRFVSFLLAISMVLTFLPVSAITAFATEGEKIIKSGNCGINGENDDSVTWKLTSNNDDDSSLTLTISGNGAMTNYIVDVDEEEDNPSPWYDNSDSIDNIVISKGVTSIGDNAFLNCSKLADINIPNSVTSIGTYAFSDCAGLMSVDIPNSVTSINNYAFSNCTGLTSVGIPNSVTSIGKGVFHQCSQLTSIIIPDSVTSIGSSVFSRCSQLTSITIPDGITSIGPFMFYGCSNLTSVTIPDSVTSIGAAAFKACDNLQTIYYTGDMNKWKRITINKTGNDVLSNLTPVYAHIVTFNYGDDIAEKPITVKNGDTVQIPTPPERKGYKVTGYCMHDATKFDLSQPVTQNTTVYAKWEEKVPAILTTSKDNLTCTVGETAMVDFSITANDDQGSVATASLIFSDKDAVESLKVKGQTMQDKELTYTTNSLIGMAGSAEVVFKKAGTYTLTTKLEVVGSDPVTKTMSVAVSPCTRAITLDKPDDVTVSGNLNVEFNTLDELAAGKDVTLTVDNPDTDKYTYKWMVDGKESNGTSFTVNVKDSGVAVTLTRIQKLVKGDLVLNIPNEEYDGKEKKVTVSSAGGVAMSEDDYEVIYTKDGVKSTDAPKDAGTYEVNITIKGGEHDGETFDEKLTIKPATITVNDFAVTVPKNAVADDTEYSATVDFNSDCKFSSELKNYLEISYQKKNGENWEPATAPVKDAGTYRVVINVNDNSDESKNTANFNKAELTDPSWEFIVAAKPNPKPDDTKKDDDKPGTEEPEKPVTKLYDLTVKNADVTIADADGKAVETTKNEDGTLTAKVPEGAKVTVKYTAPTDAIVFDLWSITSDAKLDVNVKENPLTFTMPDKAVTVEAMTRDATIESEGPGVLGTAAMIGVGVAGTAVLGYQGYMIGTELYLNNVLPAGAAIPTNTAELAKLVWTDAGKPAPAAVLAADATDEQKALTWAVENQLISSDKAADASVGRWEVIDAWNKAQEMKKA